MQAGTENYAGAYKCLRGEAYEFQVVLEWPSGKEKLGITYGVNQQGNYLVVTSVKEKGA